MNLTTYQEFLNDLSTKKIQLYQYLQIKLPANETYENDSLQGTDLYFLDWSNDDFFVSINDGKEIPFFGNKYHFNITEFPIWKIVLRSNNPANQDIDILVFNNPLKFTSY